MPLLHRRNFVRQEPPEDLRPEEEVFLCKITHEIFRTYDEFFERTILCNSLVWSCSLTGRAGLTYLEAVESERRARQTLSSFPSALLRPVLLMAANGRRQRLSELSESVYDFIRERFFIGEKVDVCMGVHRHVCEVLQVLYVQSNTHTKAVKPADSDTIIISDSDEEDSAFQRSPQVNSPSAFKYQVRIMDGHKETFTVRANQISRRKSTVTRERLKLLFKQHCELIHGTVTLKPSTVTKYRLSECSLSQFFPDPPPVFTCSPKSSPGQVCSPLLSAAEEKLKLLQQREEMAARARLKDASQGVKHKEREERERLKEAQRRYFREEKEQRRLEKEKEREKLKEEKKKYVERLKEWNKPREDLECDDLKELPVPVPVRTRLPPELFGEALMVLEFLRAFGDLFGLKDEFPDGVSLEILEEALVTSDPEGPLCELLFFFLSAIFQTLDEEQEEVSKEQAEDRCEALDEDAACSALRAVAVFSSAWSHMTQGCGLRALDLDSCTLSEILRLHIMASGADCHHGNAKLRYQKQGGFTLRDDPCVELRLSDPALLRKLKNSAVYDLNAGEKLKILSALLCKLLTLSSSRDVMDDCVEDQRAARQELREVRAEQHRRQREEAAHRVRLRKEQRLKEKEVKDVNSEAPGEPEDGQETRTEGEVLLRDPAPLIADPLCAQSPEELEREQEKVRELQDRIQRASACTSLLPLGRDRLYRRYWLLPSATALFVEDDSFGLTEDMLRPSTDSTHNATAARSIEDEEMDEPAEGSPAPLSTCSTPINRPNQWAFYSSLEEVDQLIDALNPRGLRESSLRDALIQERERLHTTLRTGDPHTYARSDDPESSRSIPECTAAAEALMEVRLRDLLLDIEDRIHQGTLGTLKVMDRRVWRLAIETGNYKLLSAEGVDVTEVVPHLRVRDRVQEVKSAASSGSATPQSVSSTVSVLAHALAHVQEGIERRFLRAPLGEEKDQKMKKNKKRDEDQASDDGSDSGCVYKSVLERWRESLLSCSSLSQVFVHLSTLERSVVWSRSILNARCRICRRKGDADNMLLCDACDRGHHTHCLRPRLKVVPEGDWFCPDCRPKRRTNQLPSRQRSSIDDEEEEEEFVEEEEPLSSTKKSLAPPPKEKAVQVTPKNRPAPAGKGSASKASAKKAMPPTAKANQTSGSEAPPRAGGARRNQETPKPSSTNHRASAGKQPEAAIPQQPRPSSGRRSSGRKYGVHELSACEQVVVEMVRHEDSWPFIKLVSRTQVPDYYDIITSPIALSTIREKVNNCVYTNTADFVSDVSLMFSNCLLFNPRVSAEYKAAQRLQLFFQSELSRLGLSEHSSAQPAKRSRH
uniref:Bromodomain adjacent to zinc finger domain protein 1A n=1 Tax=Gouania willdenowi TaxID=441366 RepID=A0A8C5HVH0_GOUWI